ncbi:MAG: DUF4162 domain-containing protein, partial [Anaerolineae bacterium]|nr:DUF4162 domain-containing protein [Anaerolineae bacterium]
SHILADVERICDTVAIIRQGELLLVAARDALLNQYAADAVELELADESAASGLVNLLETLPWVTAVTHETNRLRLRVNDVETAKHTLLPLLVQQGVVLERYEWVRPSLEEIFLTMSE